MRRFCTAVVILQGLLLSLHLSGCGGGGGGSGDGGDGGSPPPGSPVALASFSPESGTAPLEVGFDGRSSIDPEGEQLTFFWDFGNGASSISPFGSVTYEDPGTYTARLTVTDPTGLIAVAEETVEVGPPFSEETEAHRTLYLTNLERKAQGVPPLKGNADLDRAAFDHAHDMAINGYFAHDSQDGRTPWDRMHDVGYSFSTAGENIAAGYSTPAAVVAGWMASSGHRANILNASFREVGIGYFYSPDDALHYGSYWVQDFGARSNVFPAVIEDESFSTASRTVELYIYGSGWAVSMMVSEDPAFAGASWQPYAANMSWELSPASGLKTVYVRLMNGSGAVKDASDEIVLE